MDFDGDGNISMPELIADFFYFVKADINVLIADQKKKEETDALANQDADIITAIGLGTAEAGFTAQQKELHLQTRLDISRAKEERASRNLKHIKHLYEQAEATLKQSENRAKELSEELDNLQEKNATLTNQNIVLREEATRSIKKEIYEDVMVRKEKLETDLTQTRAAMISYKNMVAVVSDQVKNMKLA